MNKWLRAVCVGAAAAAMLTASAFAANYTNCADSLHEMGLFQGTQNGYDLDRTPTRAEAAVMLVRLLGKEAEAQGADLHRAVYRSQGLGKAVCAVPVRATAWPTARAATDLSTRPASAPRRCTRRSCCVRSATRMPRRDFTYANAIETAREQGIYDTGIINVQNFLRDDAADGKLHGAVRFAEEQ